MLLLAHEASLPAAHAAQAGIGLGSMVAAVTAWDRSRSVFWTIVAGSFSWFYVIYFVITRPEAPAP